MLKLMFRFTEGLCSGLASFFVCLKNSRLSFKEPMLIILLLLGTVCMMDSSIGCSERRLYMFKFQILPLLTLSSFYMGRLKLRQLSSSWSLSWSCL